jgi:glycosyltransferase involved in cell wall biosynthesis
MVIDSERFDVRTAVQSLTVARSTNPNAVLLSAPGERDRLAPETGAIHPDLGACWIKRDLWNDAAAYLLAFETASGCGTELARRARRQLLQVQSVDISPEKPEDSAELDRDMLRGEARRPGSNAFFTVLPAVAISKSVIDWIADRQVIVFPPTMGWTVPIVQRANHMAKALGKAGHAVIYSVEGVYSMDSGPPREVAPGVMAVSEPFASLAFLKDPIVIIYSYNVECASFFRRARVVYEWIDHLSVFAGEQKLVEGLHDVALRKADVVTAVAGVLWRQALAVREDALYLPNGVWVEDFDPSVAPDEGLPDHDVAWLESDNRPLMIYWGAVAPWFDDDLLAKVSRLRPDLRFAVLGPGLERDLSTLAHSAPPNLRYFGSRPYRLLASFARRATAALLPFRLNAITQATSPLKLYEYLAAKLPVVSTPLPESTSMERVLLASDPQSFAEALDQAIALRGDAGYCDWVERIIGQHDWFARAAVLRFKLGLSDAALPEPVPPLCDFIQPGSSTEVNSEAALARAHLARRDIEIQSFRSRLERCELELAAARCGVKHHDEEVDSLPESLQQKPVESSQISYNPMGPEAVIKSLRERLEWHRSLLESLKDRLAAGRNVLREFGIELLEKRKEIRDLDVSLTDKILHRIVLSARLVATVGELEEVTASIAGVWMNTQQAAQRHQQIPFCDPDSLGAPYSPHIGRGETESGEPYIAPAAGPEPAPEAPARGKLYIPSSAVATEIDASRLPAASIYDVVCFPIIDWEFRFQRPQQLCLQIARACHRVFYLRTTFHQNGDKILLSDIGNGVYGVQLPGPVGLDLYQDEMSDEELSYVIRILDEFRLRARIFEAASLVQLPFWAPVVLEASEKWGWRTIYDCMDEHSGFSNSGRSMLRLEERLFTDSDLVVTTSRALFEKASLFSRSVLQLPNACDFEHFNAEEPGDPLAHLGHPRIGYYGAISDWFDLEMITNAAQARSDWEFILIGHTTGADVSTLRGLSNVHLLGEKPYSELPGYLRSFDVASIPFVANALTRATNPVKFYEYLCAGKPVVATQLPELEQYSDYFYPVRTANEFVSQIEEALRTHTREKAAKGIELARHNTWADRYKQLSTSMNEIFNRGEPETM